MMLRAFRTAQTYQNSPVILQDLKVFAGTRQPGNGTLECIPIAKHSISDTSIQKKQLTLRIVKKLLNCLENLHVMPELALINKDVVPPGQFHFHQSETNYTIVAPSWIDLVRLVKAHRNANSLPIGLQIEREIEKQLASNLPANFVTEYVAPVKIPMPRDEWPAWAKTVALLANDSDIGVGSTIARTIGPFGGDLFKIWHRAIFGRPCACHEREAAWNSLYAYGQ